MSIGDVFQVTYTYRWDGAAGVGNTPSECTNRWFYEQLSGSPTAADALNTAFYSGVFPAITAIAGTNITWLNASIINWMDADDYLYNDFPPGVTGERVITGESPCTPVNNISFVSNRAGPHTRPARKRFPFLMESDISGKVLTPDAEMDGLIADLVDAMTPVITSGSNGFVPCVFAPNPGGYGAGGIIKYRINNWRVEAGIASQDTRKR